MTLATLVPPRALASHGRQLELDIGGHVLGATDLGGAGPAFVCLHSFGLDRFSNSALIEALRPTGARLISLDLPLHGRDTGGAPVGLSQMVDLIVGAIDRLGLEKVALFGLSMGGTLAMEIAVRCPDLVRRIFVAAAVGTGFPAMIDRANQGAATGVAAQIPGTLDRWFNGTDEEANAISYCRAALGRLPQSSWVHGWKALAETQVETRLGEVQVPAQFIAGSADKAAPPEVVKALSEKAPNGTFTQIDGAPHQLNLTHTQALASLITHSLQAEK